MSVDNFRLEDFLSAVTDALQNGDTTDVDQIAARYHLNGDDARSLVNVIRRLNQYLVPVQPSDRFVMRLRADLNGNSGLMFRVRHLPPRVRIAAGAITVAGLLYIAQRRFFGDEDVADGSDIILPEQSAANH